MAKKIHLDNRTREVLAESTITESTLTLPEFLDRGVYDRVNRVIVAAGGKWDKYAKHHKFTRDPREALGLAVESGEIVNVKQTLQQFYTPAALAKRMVAMAAPGSIKKGMTWLEPSAGIGSIAFAIRDAIGSTKGIRCVEIEQGNAAFLNEKGLKTTQGDFLELTLEDFAATLGPDSDGFDRVVMNPPFTGDQDIKHVRHAMSMLRTSGGGGRLVSVMSPRFTFVENENCREFKALLQNMNGTYEDLAAGAFAESGTSIATVLVTLEVH